MLPSGHKVGANPVFNPPAKKRVPAAGAKIGGVASTVAKTAATGMKAVGQATANAAKGGVHTGKFLAKNPSAVVKGPAAAVSNAYKSTFNNPNLPGAKATMKSNFQAAPVKSTLKVAAAVTGALAPAAAAKGLAKPATSLRTQNVMKANAADRKVERKMDGLSWTPPAKPGTPGARTPMGRPRS